MAGVAMTAITATLMPQVNDMMRGLTGTTLNNQMSKAGLYSGKSWSSGFARAVSGMKLAGIIGGTAAAVLPAAILKGGMDRALNIEDAEAKLRGLRYQESAVASITQDVLNSVLGTRFSLDQAMGAGVSALASGISKGKDLTNYLKLVSDAATIANTDLKEMGYIFNKIESNVFAYSRELSMLADRGVPIWAWLAKDLDVTVLELRKMVADSKVTSADFKRAIDNNIGGAALQSASTTRGAMRNMAAAYARTGEVILKDFLPSIREFNLANIQFADALTKRITPAMTEFWKTWQPWQIQTIRGSADSLEKFMYGGYKLTDSGFIKGLKEITATFLSWKPIAAIVDSVTSVFKDGNGNLRSFEDMIQQVINSMDWLIWGFIHLWRAIEPVLSSQLSSFFRTLGDEFEQFGTLMAGSSDTWKALGKALLWSIGNALEPIIPLLESMLPFMAESAFWVLKGLALGLTYALPAISKAFSWVLEKITAGFVWLNENMPGIKLPIASLFEGVSTALSGDKEAISKLTGLSKIIADVVLFVKPLIDMLIEALGSIFNTENMQASGGWIIDILKDIGGTLKEFFTGSGVTAAKDGLLSILQSLGQALKDIWNDTGKQALIDFLFAMGELFAALIPELVKLMPLLLDLGKSVLLALFEILTTLGPVIIETLIKLIPIIAEVLADLIPFLVEVVNQLLPHFSRILPVLAEALSELLASLLPILPPLLDLITTLLLNDAVMDNFLFLVEILASVLEVVTYIVAGVVKLISMNFDNFATALQVIADIADNIVKAFEFMNAFKPNSGTFKGLGPNGDGDLLGNLSGATTGQKIQAGVSVASPVLGLLMKLLDGTPGLATGANIGPSRDGTFARLGDGFKAETVTDLGLTNDFIANTNKLVKDVEGGQAPQITQHFTYTIENHTDLSGDTILRKIDEHQRVNSVYQGYNYG